MVIFSYHPAFDAPLADLHQYIAIPFGIIKLEWPGYPMVKKCDDMFSHFDLILACDRQTDRHLATV